MGQWLRLQWCHVRGNLAVARALLRGSWGPRSRLILPIVLALFVGVAVVGFLAAGTAALYLSAALWGGLVAAFRRYWEVSATLAPQDGQLLVSFLIASVVATFSLFSLEAVLVESGRLVDALAVAASLLATLGAGYIVVCSALRALR